MTEVSPNADYEGTLAVLRSVGIRLAHAALNLDRLSEGAEGVETIRRLTAKGNGVRLALSIIDETIRDLPPNTSSGAK